MDLTSIPVTPRELADGTIFFKLRSAQVRVSAEQAIHHGVKFVVLEAGDEEEAALSAGVPYAIVDDVNRSFARACSRIFGDAHRKLTLIGVSGSKGKTTTGHLIDGALRAAGVKTGIISSLGVRFTETAHPIPRTTPAAFTLHSFFAELHRQGATHAVVEIHSSGIADERFSGLQFDALALTNLGIEQSYFHGGIEEYAAMMRRLFSEPEYHKSPETVCVFNGDDPLARELAHSSLGRVATFGFENADLTPDSYASDPEGMTLVIGGRQVRVPLIGRHNASNVLAATAILGVLPFGNVKPLPGCLEKLSTPAGGVDIYLDSAHMPESIEVTLTALREVAGSRRIVSVLGCTARMSKKKRPYVAKAVMNGSDVCIFTTDNPGEEHPAAIVMDMLRGVPRVGANRLKTVIDRPTAIAAAVREASPDGIVVLMGKGIQEETLRRADRHTAAGALREVSTAYELNHH